MQFLMLKTDDAFPFDPYEDTETGRVADHIVELRVFPTLWSKLAPLSCQNRPVTQVSDR